MRAGGLATSSIAADISLGSIRFLACLSSLCVIVALNFYFPSLAKASTPFTITDNVTGGDCSLIGNWDTTTKTCNLTKDLYVEEGIKIASNETTLDGGGHTITGFSSTCCSGTGISIIGLSGSSVKNVKVTNFYWGIDIKSSTHIIVSNNNSSGNGWGINLEGSSDNSITGNTVNQNGISIMLQYASDTNILDSNSLMNNDWGISLSDLSSRNRVIRNHVEGGYDGVGIGGESIGSDNTVAFNTIMNTQVGFNTSGFANKFYNNNLIDNVKQAENYGADIFFQPAPVGGNYWSNYDEPDEGCNDLNSDGFCDSPYTFISNIDELPRTTANSWCGKAVLKLEQIPYLPYAYWASFSDYSNRLLSVDYRITNTSAAESFGVVFSTTATAGVTSSPFYVGDIASGDSTTFQYKYFVSPGTSGFATYNSGIATDACGVSFTYP